jgi:hypothetical protein
MTTLQEVRARCARGQGLPFADSLTRASIRDALDGHGVKYRLMQPPAAARLPQNRPKYY